MVDAALPAAAAETEPKTIEEICGRIVWLQRRRTFCIRSQSRLDRSIEAFIRNNLGYHKDLSKAARERIEKQARQIKNLVEQGGGLSTIADDGPIRIAAACSTFILANKISREPWDNERKAIEKEMIALAKRLPAYPFIQSVKGASAKTMAVIVGEAGNLAGYPTRSHLQKRLGIACIHDPERPEIPGRRQGNVGRLERNSGEAYEEFRKRQRDLWEKHGYNPQRRAEIAPFLDQALLRSQWRGDKTAEGGEPAHAIGPYGEKYARKKAEYIARGHRAPDQAARRYMAKKFIEDLWKAWRAVPQEMPREGGHNLPPAMPATSPIETAA